MDHETAFRHRRFAVGATAILLAHTGTVTAATFCGIASSWLLLADAPPPVLSSLAEGDLDGVLGPDLVAGGAILLNRGDGTFLAPSFLEADCTSSQLGDLDGDGDDDVIGSIRLGGEPAVFSVAVFVNFGSGSFGPAVHLPVQATDRIEVGDVDGTGTDDVVLAYEGELVIGQEFDAAGFATWTVLTVPTTSAQLGDLDGDGALDLICAGGAGLVLYGDGAGSWSDPVALVGYGGDGALGDLDGDGDLDAARGTQILIGDFPGVPVAAFAIYVNEGDGRFTETAYAITDFWGGYYEYYDAIDETIVDLDGDGDLDVVTQIMRYGFEPVALGFNAGTGTLESVDTVSAGTEYPSGRVLVDLDGDDRPELCVLGGGPSGGLSVQVKRNITGDSNSADLDGDGMVSFSDLTSLLARWGDCVVGCCPEDLSGDGVIRFDDLTELLAQWGAVE